MKNNRKHKYGWPLWALFSLSIIVLFGIDTLSTIFFIIIFFAARSDFERWATAINESPRYPFILYCLFGLIGMLGYYIYYRTRLRSIKRAVSGDAPSLC